MSGIDYGTHMRERLAEMLDNPGAGRIPVTVVYLREDGTWIAAQQTYSELLVQTWREGVDYIRGHHLDDSEDVRALIVAKKLVGSAEGYR